MKKLTFISLISLLIANASSAQEMHSPWLVCESKAETMYLLKGNSFPQIPDLDWSHEVAFVTKNEYQTGFDKKKVYQISNEETDLLLKTSPKTSHNLMSWISVTNSLEITRHTIDLYCQMTQENDDQCTSIEEMQCEYFF